MIHRLLIAVFLFSVITVTAEARADGFIFSKQIVETLEDAWDEAKDLPEQPLVDGIEAAKLGGDPMENKATGSKIMAVAYYPAKTGNTEVDQRLKAYAESKLAGFNTEAEDFLKIKQPGPGFKFLTFLAVPVTDKYLSVVFYESGQTGGAHGMRAYDSMVFDLKTGKQLTLAELFPVHDDDEGRILGFFVNFVNAGLDKKCFELYKDSLCNPNTVSLESVKDSLKNLVLTENGLSVIYGPYEQGPYSEGTKYLDIPKSDLMAWGIPDFFWK